MCELFALSSRLPTEVRFSLEAFSRRGGLAGRNKDGWGLAYYVDEDVRLVKEAEPAGDSACVRFLQEHPFSASVVVSHIRKATRGTPAMKNCQPFQRELGGRAHVFAHNGDLDPARLRARLPLGAYRPIGETDSEYAFCALLLQLSAAWRGEAPPTLGRRRQIVREFAGAIRELGPANFIYTDGEAVFLHGDRRMHGDGLPPHWPGLHVLQRHCGAHASPWNEEGLRLAAQPEQDVLLAASVPLSGEPGWRPLAEGELIVARQGRLDEFGEHS